MSVRRAALLVTVGAMFYAISGVSVEVYLTVRFWGHLSNFVAPLGVLSARIALALFFVFLSAEALGLTTSKTRGNIALASGLLMTVQVICLCLEIQQIVSFRHGMMPPAHVSMALGSQLFFAVLGGVGWTMLFLALPRSRLHSSGA